MKNADILIRFPNHACRIISRLHSEGYDAYAVGGCIRDSILGREPHDWDITTAANPDEVIRIFSTDGFSVIGTAGIRHGTVMVRSENDVCEITTFRNDGDYRDHRRPDSVSFSNKVEDDLSRRDFTMNAIAAKPDGAGGTVIVDPFGGCTDIMNGFIRTVGDPKKRFKEDALRILRTVRFSSELGFTVETATVNAANELRNTLEFVSAERITAELWRSMSGRCFKLSTETFPDIFKWLAGDMLPERFFKYASVTEYPAVRLALMLRHESDGKAFFSRMRFPSKITKLVTKLVSIDKMPYTRSDVCSIMRDFGEYINCACDYLHILKLDGTYPGDFYEGRELLQYVEQIRSFGIPYKPSMLALSGTDIMSVGILPINVGRLLELLLRAVQEDEVDNEKTALLHLALKLNDEI